MKQKVRRISKSTLSVILTLCMIMSCFTVGLVSVNALDSSKYCCIKIGSTERWIQMNNSQETSEIDISSYHPGDQVYFDLYATEGTGQTPQYFNKGAGLNATQNSDYYFSSGGSAGNSQNYLTVQDKGYIKLKANYSGSSIQLIVSSAWGSSTPNVVTLTPAASPSAGGTAAVSDSENGTYSTSAQTDITPGSYVWVQATPNAYYEFDGWQSTSGLTYDSPNALKSRVKVDSNATATAKFKKQTVVSSLTLSASPTTLTEVNETTTLTVTASGLQSGVTNITYEIYDSSSPSTPVATYSSTTGETSHTFSLAPNAYQKTYYAKVKQTGTENYDSVQSNNVTVTNNNDAYRTPYTVTFSSGGNGTVTAKTYDGTPISSGDTVLDGTVVFFTASPNTGYQFKNWTGSYTDTASTISKTITSDVNVTGNFEQKGYKVYTSSDHSMKELPNGWYITTDQISNSSYFKVVRLSDNKNSNSNAGDENSGTNLTDNIGQIDTWDSESNVTNHSFHNKSGGSRYVVYDPSTDRVWLTTNSDGYDVVTVYVKDGTVRKKDGGDATCHWGYSAITNTQGTSATVEHCYKSKPTGGTEDNQVRKIQIPIADIKKGVKLTIRTTVTKSGYFVKGFDVTGRETQGLISQEFDSSGNELSTYADTDAQTKIDGNYNEFVLDLQGLTVREIEVTPIYFKKETVSGDNVRFYADNFAGTVKSKWKDTIAVYAYGNDSAQLGSYPGQPMVYEGGRYYMDIENTAKGLTINNYAWDRVHSDIYYNTKSVTTDTYDNNDALYQIVKKVNRQTYDYDEFKVIQDIIAADDNLEDEDIIFSFRYRDLVDNDSSNFGAADEWNDYPQNLTTSSFEFEDLTDFYGNKTDLYGGMVNDENAGNNPLLVVSNGYDHNSVGNYATSWAIYKPTNATGDPGTYTKIAVAGKGCTSYVDSEYRSESWLIDPATQAAAIAAINNNGGSTFENYPVKICYEHEVYRGFPNGESGSGDGQLGYRVDGRWYYSRSDEPLQAHVIAEYGDSLTATSFTRDYFQFGGVDYTHEGYDKTQNTGLTTGVKAYFTNEDPVTSTAGTKTNVYGTTECDSVSDGEHTFDLEAVPDADGEYMFLGWYLYNGEGREPSFITKNPDFSVEAATNDVFIARFVKTPDNVLVISHQPHPDSEGAADRYVQVTVKNQSNETVFAFDNIKNARNLDYIYLQKTDNYKLEIVLRAEPRPGLNYDGFYESIQTAVRALAQQGVIASVSSVDTTGGVYSVTVTVNVTSLYTGDTQTIKALPFYSKFETPKHDLTITKSTDFDDGSDFNILIKTKGPDAEAGDPLTAYNGAFKLNNVAKTSSDYESDGTIKIKSGDVIKIEDIAEDSEVEVLEKLSSSSNYSHILSTSNVTGAKSTPAVSTVTTGSDGTGYHFTLGSTDAAVTVFNRIATKTVTITKTVLDETTCNEKFPITVTYTTTNGTTATVHTNEAINNTLSTTNNVILANVPIGSDITVIEGEVDHYQYVSTVGTNIGNAGDSDQTTYKVTDSTDPTIEITNRRLYDVDITKVIPDITETTTSFELTVTTGSGTAYTGSYQINDGTAATSSNGVFTIKRGQTLKLIGVAKGTVINVVESNSSNYYSYDSTNSKVTTSGVTSTPISNQDGFTFTMPEKNVAATVTNVPITQTIKIRKATDWDDGVSSFTINVAKKDIGGSSAVWASATFSDKDSNVSASGLDASGNVSLKSGEWVELTVNKGTELIITETSAGSKYAFSKVYDTSDTNKVDIANYPTSGTKTGYKYEGTDNEDITFYNLVKRNTVTITKDISDANDTSTGHEVTINATKTNGGASYDVAMPYTSSISANGGTISGGSGTVTIHEGEVLTFANIPVGVHLVITETTPGSNYKPTSIDAEDGDNVGSNDNKVRNVYFDVPTTANTTVAVTITNELQKFDLNITKSVNDKVGDTYYIKLYNGNTEITNVTLKKGDANVTYTTDKGYAISKGETLTYKNIPVNTQIKVVEAEEGTKHHWVSYAEGSNIQNSSQANGITVTMTEEKNVTITNEVNKQDVVITKEVNNSSINNVAFPISVTLKKYGETDPETSWTAQKTNDATASSYTLSSITLKNGESITLKDVPVNSTVRVTEDALTGTDLSNYTFVSAVATPSTGSTTSNQSNQTYVEFTLTDYSTAVKVTNKINDKTVTIKKAIDAGTATEFPIKVEYQLSNNTSTWVAYCPDNQNTFASDGVANITSGGAGVSVSIPLDAKIRVTEMVNAANMPSGYVFEKMTRTTSSSTTTDLTTTDASYTDTAVDSTSNGDTITVHNTQLRTVNFTKTTNVTGDTTTAFKFTVQKQAPGANSPSYVTSLLNGSNETVSADENHKFTIHKGDTLHLANVVKGTQFIVTETDTTSSYTFTATDTGVTNVDQIATANDNPVVDANAKTIRFTANTTNDPTVTINNVSVNKSFKIKKTVDVTVTETGKSFKLRIQRKGLGESSFTNYSDGNTITDGVVRITPGTDIVITGQPVGTEFNIWEETDSDWPTGYNFSSAVPTEMESGSGSVSNGVSVKVKATDEDQYVTFNNIKKSQLIVTKSITGDNDKQFPIVIKKYNTTNFTYDIDVTGSTPGVTVTDSSDNALSNRYNNGVFYISNGDKIKVDAVMGDQFKVIENDLTSNNDYLGYEFVSYSVGSTTSTAQADGKEVTIGDNSVTVTVNNKLTTKTLKLKKTVDYPYSTENSFPITIEYYDTTLTTPAYQTATTLNLTPSNSFTDVTLSGKAAVSNIRVSESTTGFVNYAPNLTTIKVGTADAEVLTSKVITNPADNTEVTIANYAKKANVKVYKDVTNDDSDTQTFPITVNYTVPGANSAQTRTATIAQTGEIDLGSLPVGTQITVSENLTGISGYTQGTTTFDGGVTYDSTNSCYVSGTTNGTITVNNTRDTAGFTIKKETNINNTVDEFKIKIWTADSLSGPWTPYTADIGTYTADTTGTESTNTNYGAYTIKKDSLLTITGLLANKYIKVQETDGMTTKYSSTVAVKDNNTTLEDGSDTTTGIVKILSGGSQGIVITNSVKTTTVNITKTVNGGASGSNKSFPITVKITDESSAENVTWSDGTHTYADGVDSSNVTINGGQTLTITDVPVGASVEVTEDSYSIDGYSFTSINATGDIANKDTSTSRKVTFNTAGGSSGATVTIVNTVATKDVVIKKNVTNSNKTDQAFTINVSLKLNGSGDSTTTTAWTYDDKDSTTHTNASLTGISLNNGDYITLKEVPVGAYITVDESSVPSGYSFDSIVAKHSGTTVIGSSNISPYSFTLLSSYTSPEVTVNNKIGDKTVNIKKVTDSSDGTGFYIKVEYLQSNSGAAWTTVEDDTHFTNGIASFAHNTEYTVSIPSDAQIKVSELNETGHTMPSGYEFEKFSLLENGGDSATDLTTGVDGMVYTSPTGSTIGDGDTIIVNNTKLNEVKVTKTATGNPNTSDKFAFKLQKQNGSDWDDVATLTNVGVGGAGTAFSTKVRKGTVIRVIENNLNTDKYDFDDSTTNTKVTTSGVSGTNVKDTTNGIYGITNITMPENKDVELTINNLVKTQTVKVTKTTDDSTDTTTAFGIKIQKKLEGASGEFADFTTSEQYKLKGAVTGTNFASGSTVSLKRGEYFTVEVPIDTQIQVSEPSPTAPYSLAGIDVDHSKSDPAKSYSNGVLTFTVDSGTMPTVTVTNSKSLTLTVTKQTDSTDGTDDLFPILIETNESGTFIPVTSGFKIGSLTAEQLAARVDTLNLTISIKKGETITITDIPTNTEFRVSEPTVTSGYEFGSVEVPDTADSIAADGTNGKKFTITTSNVAVTVNNKKQHTVSIDKIVPSAEIDTVNNPDFTVKIETKAPGAGNFTVYDGTVTGGTKVGTGNDTTYTFKAGGTITLGTKYIAGTQVRVTEVIDSSNKYEWISSVLANAESTEYTSSDKVITFTMRAQDENVDITNNIKKHDVTIDKAYLTGDSNSATHTVNVTVKQFGSTDSAATFSYEYDGSTVTGATASTNLTIQKGKTLTIKDVYVDAQVTVTETATDTGYVFDHIEYQADGDASPTTGNNFTMPDETVAVTVYNKLTTHTVTIQKVVLNADNTENTTDTTTFTLNVTNGGTTTNPTITRAANVVISDVPYGTTFKVNETNLPGGYQLVDIKIGNTVVTNVEQTITENTTFVVTNKISAPTEYSYQIKYIFPSRYDHLTGERKNGTQSFTRKGVLRPDDDYGEDSFEDYFSVDNNNITEALVLAKQPTESNFYMDMSISSIVIGAAPTGENPVYTATATFTDTAKTFTVHFRFPYEVEAVYAAGSSTPGAYKPKVEQPTRDIAKLEIDNKILGVGYQSIPTVTVREEVDEEEQDVTHYTEAADTILSGGAEKKFRYWSIKAKNSMGDWVEVAKSGYRLYKYSTFGEYVITPIYEGDTAASDSNITTINYLGATRNYWKMADASDTAAKGDRNKPSLTSENFVSVDFDVSFQYNGMVIKEDDAARNYNTGVIIEKVDDVDEEHALNEWDTSGTTYQADYAHYATTYADPDALSWIETYLKNGNLGGHTLFTNHVIAHNKLTNKNRTELGVSTTVGHTDMIDGEVIWDKLSNNYVKKDALFRAYAYIYDTESKTILSLSTPVYYTLKNVAEMN